jgi:hypothetical protein
MGKITLTVVKRSSSIEPVEVGLQESAMSLCGQSQLAVSFLITAVPLRVILVELNQEAVSS